MLNMVEIEPGFLAGNDLGLVEIEPGYGIHGADDVQLVGSGMGAYDDVQLVGYDDVQLVGAEDERPYYKRPLVVGGIVAGLLVAATGGYYLMRD